METLRSLNLDAELYSLQIGDGEEETAKYSELIDISDKIKSYDDTLALMENLDYVITSCTSVLHASAIVGTKTLALIPISAYFTWVSPAPDNTSIWYPDNLRLFRQITPIKWDEPLAQLYNFLKDDLNE
jgi:ADP-heptose:LPS heptosyltransferase